MVPAGFHDLLRLRQAERGLFLEDARERRADVRAGRVAGGAGAAQLSGPPAGSADLGTRRVPERIGGPQGVGAEPDAAAYLALNEGVSLQLNIENLFDEGYYASAHGDNNIQPGKPLTASLGLRLDF